VRKKLFVFVFAGVLSFLAVPVVHAANSNSVNYYRAKVVAEIAPSEEMPQQLLMVQILNGPYKGIRKSIQATGLYSASDITLPTYSVGDIVVISATPLAAGSPQFAIIDHYRIENVSILVVLVVILALVFAGWRGIGSLVGLVISLSVVGGFVIPQILHGSNPYLVALLGCFVIAALGIFVAHGLSRRTGLALIATYITLILAAGLSLLSVHLTNLNGIATEDAAYLHQQLPFHSGRVTRGNYGRSTWGT
jgi:uncharacterized membrane protein